MSHELDHCVPFQSNLTILASKSVTMGQEMDPAKFHSQRHYTEIWTSPLQPLGLPPAALMLDNEKTYHHPSIQSILKAPSGVENRLGI